MAGLGRHAKNSFLRSVKELFGPVSSPCVRAESESFPQDDPEMKKKKNTITAEELDRKFDAGEDISQYLDWENARRPGLDQRRVNVDLPVWMIGSLDREAKRVGVTRQSIVKVWLAERIKAEQGGAGQPATRPE